MYFKLNFKFYRNHCMGIYNLLTSSWNVTNELALLRRGHPHYLHKCQSRDNNFLVLNFVVNIKLSTYYIRYLKRYFLLVFNHPFFVVLFKYVAFECHEYVIENFSYSASHGKIFYLIHYRLKHKIDFFSNASFVIFKYLRKKAG